MHQVWSTFQLTTDSYVLDVGGTRKIWSLLPTQPRLVFLNLLPPNEEEDGMADVFGNACRLPFKDAAFDLVFSNSLIEHLYTLEHQQEFADECRRVGHNYFVQCPNRHFPVEPHLLTPFIHWFPRTFQVRLLRNFTIWGWLTRPDPSQCDQFVNEVRMITVRELRTLFPEANIWREKVAGLTKSIMAVKCH